MRESMEICPITAMERAMKLQEVLLRATSGKIKWWQAAELIGISARQLRRRRKRYEEEATRACLTGGGSQAAGGWRRGRPKKF
jgi:hypothetical protein